MKPKQTQLERIKGKLKRDGFITRNECINLPYNKITRLSQYIMLLRQQGYEIDMKEVRDEKGLDTIYTLVKKPAEKEFKIIERNGERVAIIVNKNAEIQH